MGWPTFEDNTAPKSKKVLDTDDDSGAIGKVSSLKVGGARRKKTKVEMEARNRINVPEEDWTTGDLAAEFYDLYMETCGGVAPNQINGKHLMVWINKLVGEGVQRIHILKGIRMFFGDARVIADPGVGVPIYRRFMSYYGTVHGIVSRVDEPIGLDEDTLAHQEKMLKLLES